MLRYGGSAMAAGVIAEIKSDGPSFHHVSSVMRQSVQRYPSSSVVKEAGCS